MSEPVNNIPIGIKSGENIPIGILKKKQGGRKGNALATAHGGRLVRGRYIKGDSPVAQTLKKCDECVLRGSCAKFLKKARCYYQIQNLQAEYKMQSALTSGDPQDLLKNIQSTIAKLESVINYDEMLGNPPNKNDIKELAFLKLQIYEMVYGRKPPATAVQVNTATIDVKGLMSELREKEK